MSLKHFYAAITSLNSMIKIVIYKWYYSVGEICYPLGNSLDKQQLIWWKHECNSACEQNTQNYLFWVGVCLKTNNAKRKVNNEFA